jgi:hypothetical protein
VHSFFLFNYVFQRKKNYNFPTSFQPLMFELNVQRSQSSFRNKYGCTPPQNDASFQHGGISTGTI